MGFIFVFIVTIPRIAPVTRQPFALYFLHTAASAAAASAAVFAVVDTAARQRRGAHLSTHSPFFFLLTLLSATSSKCARLPALPPFLPFLFPSLFADVDNGVKTRACVECAAALFQRVARCALRVARCALRVARCALRFSFILQKERKAVLQKKKQRRKRQRRQRRERREKLIWCEKRRRLRTASTPSRSLQRGEWGGGRGMG